MKKSTFFQGLYIALFVLISNGLKAQCQTFVLNCPATCECCICIPELRYVERWDFDPCLNCPLKVSVTDHLIYVVQPEGRAEAFLTRTLENVRDVQFTNITNSYNNRAINERFEELERNYRSRTGKTEGELAVQEKNAAENFTLSQNAPNPFSASTSIDYVLPATAQRGQLSLYDSKGQLIKQWKLQDSGSININTDGLAPGNYFYRLSADGLDLATRKMVVL